MRISAMLLGLASWLILLSPMLVLSACVGAPPIVATPSACASLLPEEWRQPVMGAALPLDMMVGSWVAFSDAQTAQLDKANDRGAATIYVIERCEQLHRDAIAQAKRPWWKIF